MIPYYRLSLTKTTLSFVLAISVIFWGISCQTFQQSSFVPAYDRFYNARVVRDFTRSVADGVVASCGRSDTEAVYMAFQLRGYAEEIDALINSFVDTPEYMARLMTVINAAADAGRPAWDRMKSCGGNPPEVPNVPGYYETFWEIAS